ncbi:unnamed protein product [Owenia fusiformis]|uniref:oligopeptidase A n=1 Tax=Owenia fusiformis TaxID=6347 RepID=A0A8J1UKB8_OWEFU|nr:unnamed protein product [Owenia fusiformis]
MAASMIRCRFCNLSNSWAKTQLRNSSGQYYVLLPEVPPDTPETNSVMRTNDLPVFSEITPEKCISGGAKLAIQYETQLGELVEKLKDPNYKKTFESVLDPIEGISVPMSCAWRTTKNLNYVKGTKDYRHAFSRIHPQIERAKNERWLSEPLYNAVKELGADRSNLNNFQERLVDMYLLEARLNGIELQGTNRKRFVETLKKLSNERHNFRNKTHICTNLFSQLIGSPQMMKDFPKDALRAMAANKSRPDVGPWKVTLQPDIYQTFLTHCPDRMMRWNVWQAYNTRATDARTDQNLSNHKIITDIRMYRRDIAMLLGYENFAQMSMETKMAGSIENVMNMLDSCKSVFKPFAVDEIATLQDFALSRGGDYNLQAWDIPYWREQQAKELFHLDSNEVAQYFPLPSVLEGLFEICSELFQISFKDVTADTDVWHPDVQVFQVSDSNTGDYISTFYLDAYARPGEKLAGSWMETGRERSDSYGTTPFSYLNMSLPRPLPSRDALLTMQQLSSLFHEFGHGLQQMLTEVPYSELSGQRNIEWDVLQVCSTLMTRLLYQPSTLKRICKHHETGKSMPDTMIQQIIESSKHMSSYDMVRQLYFAAYDMEVYVSKDYWADIMRRLWPEFIPVPLNEEDFHPCSMTQIFSDQYPAAYYSYKWAEMISADVFSQFEAAGFENKKEVAEVGKRFRDTFLALGGGVPASQVFRKFCGRDPALDSLLNQYGLNNNGGH